MPATLDEILNSHRPMIMGILNVTPDSFSDGGQFFDPQAAANHAVRMIDEGADIIDIGPESTRPGSDRITAAEQIDRLREILPAVTARGVLVSIDTTLAEVAAFAIDAGAVMLNDVSAGRDNPELLALAAGRNVPVVLMHMLGEPKIMQARPHYDDVVAEVRDFLAERIAAAKAAGVAADHIIVDPGIGFGKLLEHNLALLAGVNKLLELGCPVLVGPSRKRFIGELTAQSDPKKRVSGTVAACLAAWHGGATIFRVHDISEVKAAFTVAVAIENANIS